MSGMKDEKKHPVDDWMVRVSFAEAGEPDMGFSATGLDIERKTRFAMEKAMVVKSEKIASGQQEGRESPTSGRRERVEGGERLNLMILDDEPLVGKRLEPTLTAAGFDVEVFLDPAKALSRISEKEFDIIITDFQMDEIDGIQVLEYIMERCSNTRVILITAYGTVEIARAALVKGAFDFIAKPFKAKELRAVVNKAALSLGHRPVGL